MTAKQFIELHIIQNFAPSNLNRDDTGTPKDCYFGGHRRARISSQCAKRAIRTHHAFLQKTQADESFRTNRVFRLFKPQLLERGKPEDEVERAITAFSEAYLGKGAKIKADKEGVHKSNMLFYLGTKERDALVDLMLAHWEQLTAKDAKVCKKSAEKIVKDQILQEAKGVHAPDVAMFGRMLAGNPKLNIDAACHVSHAVSTHAIHIEDDYFTAVDDLQKAGEETGASMLGFKQFNSPCYYRYACIDFDQLIQNLLNDTASARRAVAGFLHALVKAVPSGMQSGFAAYNEPALLLAVVREDGQFWNLINAFERPVYASSYYANSITGLIEPSVRRLDQHWGKLKAFYDDAIITQTAVHTFEYTDSLQHLSDSRVETLSQWVEAVVSVLSKE